MKVLANDGIAPAGKAKLEAAGHTVITDKVNQEDLVAYMNAENIDVLLVRSATTARKELIDACPNLKMIGRGGVGMDNIDVQYGRDKGLQVFNTPGASSQAVAELVIAHLFGLSRSLNQANRSMPDEGKTEFSTLKKAYAKGQELRGKTIGIIGFGRIGQFTARYALGLGMKVVAHDTTDFTAEIPIEINGTVVHWEKVSTCSLDELFQKADIISLNVPKQSDGSAVIGKAEIEKMKNGVILINTSRGGTIEEGDLIAALESGKVRAAALDVFENEPSPREDLLKMDALSLSPHIGAATLEAQSRIGEELADFIIEHSEKSLA